MDREGGEAGRGLHSLLGAMTFGAFNYFGTDPDSHLVQVYFDLRAV